MFSKIEVSKVRNFNLLNFKTSAMKTRMITIALEREREKERK